MAAITTKSLMDLIHLISHNIDRLQTEIALKNHEIEELKLKNQQLKESNSTTLDQIRSYIKELEQIKSHYADNNNNS